MKRSASFQFSMFSSRLRLSRLDQAAGTKPHTNGGRERAGNVNLKAEHLKLKTGSPSVFSLAVFLVVIGQWSLVIGQAAPAFVYETPWEMQADGDFDGDGRRDLVILDKATGNYRLAYQVTPGNYNWVSTRASGISGATGLGIGRLTSLTYDALAVTGPDANRVNILDASSGSAAGLPASVYLPSIGPNGVGVINIGGGGDTTPIDVG